MYIVSFALDKTSYGAILEYSHGQPVLKLGILKKKIMMETEFIDQWEGNVYISEIHVLFSNGVN